MDFLLHRTTDLLDSTGYIEIGPGPYRGEHWQSGFVFVDEDAFGLAEGIVHKRIEGFDHFGINEVSQHIGRSVVADLRAVATRLRNDGPVNTIHEFHLDLTFRSGLERFVFEQPDEVATFLDELAGACETFLENNSSLCILGL